MMENRSRLVRFLMASRPLFLLGAAMLFALGSGIARYLGNDVDWVVYLLGQGLVTSLQLGAHFLNEYYDTRNDNDNANRTPFSGGSGQVGEGKLPRKAVYTAAMGCLLAALAFSLIIVMVGKSSPQIMVVIVLAFLGAVFYSSPPLRLVSSGYGELVTSILVANLVPTFGFLLQANDLHRLLAMSTFPLTAMHLAMMLAFQIPDYAADLKYLKKTLMIRAGWVNGMRLHDGLIAAMYLLLGLAIAQGMPFAIGLPPLLTLPLGLLQITQMRQVANGAKPNYLTLTLTPVAIFGAVVYLLAFGYWTR